MAVVGMALEQRGVIHHSDRGSQYISITFGDRCREAGAVDDGADLHKHQGGAHPHPQVRRLDKALYGAPTSTHSVTERFGPLPAIQALLCNSRHKISRPPRCRKV